jgi:hypothetical protein
MNLFYGVVITCLVLAFLFFFANVLIFRWIERTNFDRHPSMGQACRQVAIDIGRMLTGKKPQYQHDYQVPGAQATTTSPLAGGQGVGRETAQPARTKRGFTKPKIDKEKRRAKN